MAESAAKLAVGSRLGPERLEMTLDKMKLYENWPAEKNLHCDDEVAKSLGLPQPICRALMFSVAVDKMLYRAFGPDYLQRNKLSLKYLKAVFPGDICTAHGEVSGAQAGAGATSYTVEVWIENRKNETVASGQAEIVAAGA